MKTNRIIFVIGVLIFLVPFTGFPGSWEDVFLIISGLIIMALSSLNLWQRSILKRLQYHSRQMSQTETSAKPVTHEEEGEENIS